ncbi:MAG: hypothetical protein V5A64_06540 [Candidatus Thermoplasmatota archaeon]
MKPKVSFFIFAILILSDLFIGAYGHFAGSTSEISVESFKEYITSEETRNELILVLIVAIFIVLVLHFKFGV